MVLRFKEVLLFLDRYLYVELELSAILDIFLSDIF